MEVKGEKQKNFSIFSFILLLLKGNIFIIFSIISLLIIFVATYFFSYKIIAFPFSGNDALNNLNYIVYLDRYFPKIPFWYPYQGGGISITLGYPQFFSYTVILLHRLLGLTYFSSVGVLNFLSILFPAWGIYFFCALRLKNKTAGFLAGILYLLSPMPFIWIWGAGFLQQTFSIIFFMPFLIFYDWLLDNALQGKKQLFALFLAGIFGALCFYAHPATLLGLIPFGFFYAFGRAILFKRDNILRRLFWGIGITIVVFALVWCLVAVWYLPLQAYLNFSNKYLTDTTDPRVQAQVLFWGTLGLFHKINGYPYTDFSISVPIWVLGLIGVALGVFLNRKVAVLALLAFGSLYFGGSLTPWTVLVKINPLLASFFTIRYWYPVASTLNPIAAAFGAIFLGQILLYPLQMMENKKTHKVIVFILGSARQSFHAILSVVIVILFLYLLNPFIGFYDSTTPWITPLGPTVAGFDTREIWNRSGLDYCNLTYDKQPLLCKNKTLQKYFSMNTLTWLCDRYPYSPKPIICQIEKRTDISKYCHKSINYDTQACDLYKKGALVGPQWVPIDTDDINNFISSCRQNKNLISFHPYYSPCLALGKSLLSQLESWPLVPLSHGNENLNKYVDLLSFPKPYLSVLTSETHRIDVTPFLGTLEKGWNIVYKSYQLNAYTGQLSIIKTFYSLFTETMYNPNPKSENLINNLAHYFGTEGIIVNTSVSPMDSFRKAGWNIIVDNDKAAVFPPFKTGLVSITTKPRVLVLGQKDIYKQIFAEALKGVIPFQKGILIQGPKSISDISDEDLSSYSLVVLDGYSYKDREAELRRLYNYINNGGSLFVDTGWQYVSDDWGQIQNGSSYETDFPLPFPISHSTWGNVGTDWGAGKISNEFSKGVNLSGFNSLTWESGPWGLDYSQNLQDFASPILSVGGNTIVAGGNLGKGKVIWSGMNLFAHESNNESKDERQFLTNIFSYLIPSSQDNEGNFLLARPNSDELDISINNNVSNGSSLYFREAYYPSWQAEAISNGNHIPLSISVAGPEFMLVNLPALKSGDEVVFRFTPPIELYEGLTITILTFFIMIIFVFDDLFFRNRIFSFFYARILKLLVISVLPLHKKMKRIHEEFGKEEDNY